MSVYTLASFAQVVAGRVVGPGAATPIARWAYDSRLPLIADGACFLALDGPRRSGFAYVEQMYERGVRLFCISEAHAPHPLPPEATVLYVADVLAALQGLAAHRRAAFAGQLVAITGSNGKTIVKEWLYALLGGRRAGSYRSPGSANSQLGVALSVLGIPTSARTAIIEVGISRAGEMAALASILAPVDLGVLTTLGAAHDAGFASRAAKAEEKLSLFASAQTLIASTEGETGEAVRAFAKTRDSGPELLAWSERGAHGSWLASFDFPYTDAASRENLCHALLAARHLGASDEQLRGRLATLPRPTLRLSSFRGRDGCRVIDDTYSADREGLLAAVEFFSQRRLPSGRAVAVLGPLRESGLSGSELRATVAAAIAPVRFDRVITLGAELADLAQAVTGATDHIHAEDLGQLLKLIDAENLRDASVLLKGPRDLKLEQVAAHLRARAHDVRLEIDLGALTDNLAAFRRRLAPSTRICVMVKAQAYGSGSPELARLLADRGVDYLAVAYVDEAVELRRAGSALPIIVANASAAQVERLARYGLEPEITSLEQLRALGGSQQDLPGVHLKIDTGMHRLGFPHEGAGFAALLEELAAGSYRVLSVFSHLSASDDPAADAFTRMQNDRLVEAADQIDAALGYRPLRHVLNSAGAWRLPDLQHDMVRLGIGIYGAGPVARLADASALSPAHRWLASLVRVHDVAAGEVVGYGLGGRADHARRVGVVNVGYADGLRRAAGQGRLSLFVAGRAAPTVGSICMDFCMVDLAAIPEARVGDAVEIFGRWQTVGALAECFDTIEYEVFTGIGERVRRVYYR